MATTLKKTGVVVVGMAVRVAWQRFPCPGGN